MMSTDISRVMRRARSPGGRMSSMWPAARRLRRAHRGISPCVVAAAASKPRSPQRQPAPAPGDQQDSYGLDAGWGVEVVPPPPPPTARPKAAPQKQRGSATTTQPGSSASPSTPVAPAAGSGGRSRRAKRGTPFVDVTSAEGVMGLTRLQRTLEMEGEVREQALGDVRAALAQVAAKRRKLPGAAARRQVVFSDTRSAEEEVWADMEEGEDEEENEEVDGQAGTPDLQITFGSDGQLESFSRAGVDVQPLLAASSGAAPGAVVTEDFGAFGWEQFDEVARAEGWDPEADEGEAESSGDGDQQAAASAAMLADLSQEDEWGLSELGARRSVLADMGARGAAARLAEERSASSVQWGGSLGASRVDEEETEALLARFFKPDRVKALMVQQREAVAAAVDLKGQRSGRTTSERKLIKQLRIVAGSAAGRRLVSQRGSQTRPMMEKVRAALFDSLLARVGGGAVLPRDSRWLDLFAGTGSVGLEALSRGAGRAHFVEADPWTVRHVLGANIEACGFRARASSSTAAVEEFLRRAGAGGAGAAYDFVSMCPPYLLVSYPELFRLLGDSQLLAPHSVVFVEYPRQLGHEMVETLGPLARVRTRSYGRTLMATYAAPDAAGDADDERW